MRTPRFFGYTPMYEVTVRTDRGRMLFKPTPAVTTGVLLVLARAMQLYQIALHAFTYLSNHAHLLLSDAVGDRIAPFMGYVNRNTAKLVQKETGWAGKVWTRYRPIPVLDDDSAVHRLEYVIANGVKEGLVASPLDWPGASSTRALVEGTPIVVEGDQTIELTPIPPWQDLTLDERRDRARAIVELVETRGRRDRGGAMVLGVDAILKADPYRAIELAVDRRPARAAHATDRNKLATYRVHHELFLDDYNHGREVRRRQIVADRAFPPGGYPTPLGFNREG